MRKYKIILIAGLTALIFGATRSCSSMRFSVPASTKEESGPKRPVGLDYLKQKKLDFPCGHYGTELLDYFVNEYVDGNGNITCVDSKDSFRFYELRCDDRTFMISPIPIVARGSHYAGNIKEILSENSSQNCQIQAANNR
ncbi:hypothetical protein HY486_03545 [Candidatus Woesearchaeota archaeon]|nr:hypothetical protein [Candidatus Woesearchaeota archaeon]